VKNALANFVNFKKGLINEYDFKSKDPSNVLFHNPLPNNPVKNKIEIISYVKMRGRYNCYTAKVFIYMILLIGIILWNFISALKSNKTIYLQQDQLQFANYISSEVSTSYVTMVELFASNDTMLIQGKTPFSLLKSIVTEIQAIQTEIPRIFQERDSSYDPEVKAILYDNDGCHRFQSTILYHCDSLANVGVPTNVLPLIAAYESLLNLKIHEYEIVNKTTMGEIISAGMLHINNTLPMYSVIANEAHIIGEIIDRNMSENIDNAYEQRTLFLVMFSLSLVAVSILIWTQILLRVREVNNDFKNVLVVFPPNLILSSFLLKNFLKKDSHGIQL